MCFPVGITGFDGTSRDAHRAMFPSLRWENFYSQRENTRDEHKEHKVNLLFPVNTFTINVVDAIRNE